MAIANKFNELMSGFISEPVDFLWLKANPEGLLRNGSSCCHYLLKKIDGQFVLGAYGVSRFTNARYFEITESGEVIYKWYCLECYFPDDPNSEAEMIANNKSGYDRMRLFGIKTEID